MITYTRTCKISGFHILRKDGLRTQVAFSFLVLINGKLVRETITEWFPNEGDAPHLGEEMEVTIHEVTSDNGNDYYTVEVTKW